MRLYCTFTTAVTYTSRSGRVRFVCFGCTQCEIHIESNSLLRNTKQQYDVTPIHKQNKTKRNATKQPHHTVVSTHYTLYTLLTSLPPN